MKLISPDILYEIYRHLEPSDIQILRNVSKHFYNGLQPQKLKKTYLVKYYPTPLKDWLISCGLKFDNVMKEAAKGGHLDILNWLRSQNPPYPWYGNILYEAAEDGNLDVLKWICSQDILSSDEISGWDEETTAKAAKGGHLKTLQWLRSENPPCDWNIFTSIEAAEGGHLEILKWVKEQQPYFCIEPCTSICRYAAKGGHLEILKWARQQNPPCPWDEWACELTVENGHFDILRWLRSQNPPCPWNMRTLLLILKSFIFDFTFV
jgi:hypothetical protein